MISFAANDSGGSFFLCLIFFILELVFASNSSIRKKKETSIEISSYNEQYSLYKKSLEEYQENEDRYITLYEIRSKELNEFTNKANSYISEITKDINDISEKIQEAYSANIIPLPFRDIYGVTYLYDYISTSSQSLSEALMQANLDAIKNKLDNVINLQAENIIRQAKANTAMIEQNRQILETARATMNNTAVAAKYAQISAINISLSLELQGKQLAYQTVDFLF